MNNIKKNNQQIIFCIEKNSCNVYNCIIKIINESRERRKLNMKNERRIYTEVYTVLLTLSNEDLNKIPMNIRQKIAEKADTNYSYKAENLLPESKAIVIELIKRYCENEKINEKIDEYIEYNNRINEEKRNENRSLFQEDENRELKENNSMVEYKSQNYLHRLFEKIKRLLKK